MDETPTSRRRRKPRAAGARMAATALSVASTLTLGGVLAWRDQPSATTTQTAAATSSSSTSSARTATTSTTAASSTPSSGSAATSHTSTSGS